MREVFALDNHADPGHVFYTITREDVGKVVIQTEIGPLNLTDAIGRVIGLDVGRRLYRVPAEDGKSWTWQAESLGQRLQRTQPAGK